jgi:hypothetical protein
VTFPLIDLDLACRGLDALAVDSEPGSKAEKVGLELLEGHPFFRLWNFERAGRRQAADFDGEIVGPAGQWFTPEIFDRFQGALETALGRLAERPGPFIEAKLDLLAHVKGVTNLSWRTLPAIMGQAAARYFDQRWQEALTFYCPRQLTIILTYHCNLSCDFCFSRELSRDEPGYLGHESVDQILDWIRDKDLKNVCLFGGEPTIHPRFLEMLAGFSAQGYRVYFATNGQYSDDVARGLAEADILKITLSLPTARRPDPRIIDRLRLNLGRLRPTTRVEFRLTLTETDDNLEPAERLLGEFRPGALTVALAFPSPGFNNDYVDRESITRLVPRLLELIELAERHGLPAALVKPIPLCRLDEPEAAAILKRMELFNVCDIRHNDYTQQTTLSLNSEFYPCIALHQLRGPSLKDEPAWDRLSAFNRSMVDRLSSRPPLDDCPRCNLGRSGLCQGLCYAYNLGADPGGPSWTLSDD